VIFLSIFPWVLECMILEGGEYRDNMLSLFTSSSQSRLMYRGKGTSSSPVSGTTTTTTKNGGSSDTHFMRVAPDKKQKKRETQEEEDTTLMCVGGPVGEQQH